MLRFQKKDLAVPIENIFPIPALKPGSAFKKPRTTVQKA